MDESSDFVAILGSDIAIKIFRCLDDPSDLGRASAVSTYWRRFVIENRLSKLLCLQIFPQLSDINGYEIQEDLAMDHIKYISLARSITSSELTNLVYDTISASSTDHYYEGIENTLMPGDEIDAMYRYTYWSSIGETDPQVPESLVYKLLSDLCVVTEIHVQPHQGLREEVFGRPIYSAKAVKFRLGRPDFNISEKFVWTYESPEFPMIQRAEVQKFVLPEPVLCIGGIMQIELLGRIIKHPLDDMYYVCVSYVQALGRNMSPEFDVEIIDESGRCIIQQRNCCAGL